MIAINNLLTQQWKQAHVLNERMDRIIGARMESDGWFWVQKMCLRGSKILLGERILTLNENKVRTLNLRCYLGCRQVYRQVDSRELGRFFLEC